MARILVVYKEFPAPSVGHAGGQAVFQLLACLHRRGHQVYLVARLRRDEAPLVPEMASFCRQVITVPHHNAMAGLPLLAWICSYLGLRRAAARAMREIQPDVLHVEVTQTAISLLGLPRPRSSFRPLDVNWYLLEQRAAQQRGWRRWLERGASLLFRRFEPWLCRRYDVIAPISEGDRRLLAPGCPKRPLVLLPLELPGALAQNVDPAVAGEMNLLFVGAMYRTFNVQAVQWFLREVWPRVQAQLPAVRFYIVGHRPAQEIRAWHDGRQVVVTGFVEDVAPWYRAAAVFVSPMLVGGGLLQKVVDAMAMGVPVVATAVSNHGLGATPGEHLLVADDAETFAAAVIRLLADPPERARLAQAGQNFVRERYDLEQAISRWEAALLAEDGAG
ncbi:MAG: glycosyltransferase [Anaerolineae bacterium]|nr:glycosyltransferase [Anaerolineae bacterium]